MTTVEDPRVGRYIYTTVSREPVTHIAPHCTGEPGTAFERSEVRHVFGLSAIQRHDAGVVRV